MRYTLAVQGRMPLAVECGEDLARQAQTLLRMLARDAAVLRDGGVVEFGWAPLKLVAKDGALELWEPDFESEPPVFRPQADTLLRVLAKQSAVTHACGARATAARFDDVVEVGRGALDAERIELVRDRPQPELRHSGWHLMAAGASGSVKEEMPVQCLLQRRPPVMKLLALPAGYRAVINGADIEDVFDDQGRPVWPFAGQPFDDSGPRARE